MKINWWPLITEAVRGRIRSVVGILLLILFFINKKKTDTLAHTSSHSSTQLRESIVAEKAVNSQPLPEGSPPSHHFGSCYQENTRKTRGRKKKVKLFRGLVRTSERREAMTNEGRLAKTFHPRWHQSGSSPVKAALGVRGPGTQAVLPEDPGKS